MPVWFYYIVSVILHEIFHLLTGRIFFREEIKIRFLPGGFRASWKNFQPGKLEQCIICAAGPAGNILIAALFLFLPVDDVFRKEFIKANLFIGLFNLIPLYPMDGGSIMLVVLYSLVGSSRTLKIMETTGKLTGAFLLAAGLYLLLIYKNPSLFITMALLPGIKSIKRSVNRLNLDAFLRRKERILKKRVFPVRHILVLKNISLGEAVLLLDHDRFHIILVADENMKIIMQLSEQQLVDAIINQDAGKTIEEVFCS